MVISFVVTRDVDSIRPLDDELRRAIHVIAERHGLAANWLNDHAAAWAPATMDISDCEVVVERPGLHDNFASADDIVDASHAFPLEQPDEHLGEFIATELGKGGFQLTLRQSPRSSTSATDTG